MGKQAYQLELFTSINIYPVFHVLLLELYEKNNRTKEIPFLVLMDKEEVYEVDQVLDSRIHYCGLQYLVK